MTDNRQVPPGPRWDESAAPVAPGMVAQSSTTTMTAPPSGVHPGVALAAGLIIGLLVGLAVAYAIWHA